MVLLSPPFMRRGGAKRRGGVVSDYRPAPGACAGDAALCAMTVADRGRIGELILPSPAGARPGVSVNGTTWRPLDAGILRTRPTASACPADEAFPRRLEEAT
jgi:hypothetical protein